MSVKIITGKTSEGFYVDSSGYILDHEAPNEDLRSRKNQTLVEARERRARWQKEQEEIKARRAESLRAAKAKGTAPVEKPAEVHGIYFTSGQYNRVSAVPVTVRGMSKRKTWRDPKTLITTSKGEKLETNKPVYVGAPEELIERYLSHINSSGPSNPEPNDARAFYRLRQHIITIRLEDEEHGIFIASEGPEASLEDSVAADTAKHAEILMNGVILDKHYPFRIDSDQGEYARCYFKTEEARDQYAAYLAADEAFKAEGRSITQELRTYLYTGKGE